MKKYIFREYDVRGIYPTDLNEEDAYTFGHAFASYIKNNKVIIGHDNRLSSEGLNSSLVKGLLQGGAHVIDLGLCTTPICYYYKKLLNVENGIMITASHNPKEYNGFKFSFSIKGNACGKEIYDFRDFLFNGNFRNAQGFYQEYNDNFESYINKITESIDLGSKKIKAVFDPGNGTGSIILERILKKFDIDYKIINGISDGNFPAHHPDPSVEENMQMLKEEVTNNHFDIALGIDGDADRVGVVDDKAVFTPIDNVMINMYKYLNPNLKNRNAIMDVKCSRAVIDEMRKINLPLTIYRTGNSYMNLKINEMNLDFGGEFSGHLWFKDKWIGTDDGIYNALRIIEMLSKSDKTFSEMSQSIPKYYHTPEIKIEVTEENKSKIIDKLKEYLDNENIKYNNIDGIRIDYEDGFTLIRQSNTGPVLTVRFERKDEESLEKEKQKYLDLIKKISLEIN